MIEIERRFLVASLPDPLPAGDHIVQGYLMTTPAGVRVRRRGDVYTLTVKAAPKRSDGGMTRVEVEREISQDEFDALWDVATDLRIEKMRHEVDLGGGLFAELDLFEGDLEGRRLVEVEFASTEAADAFVAPDWFGREVTTDPNYTNASLARHGWPSERSGPTGSER